MLALGGRALPPVAPALRTVFAYADHMIEHLQAKQIKIEKKVKPPPAPEVDDDDDDDDDVEDVDDDDDEDGAALFVATVD